MYTYFIICCIGALSFHGMTQLTPYLFKLRIDYELDNSLWVKYWLKRLLEFFLYMYLPM